MNSIIRFRSISKLDLLSLAILKSVNLIMLNVRSSAMQSKLAPIWYVDSLESAYYSSKIAACGENAFELRSIIRRTLIRFKTTLRRLAHLRFVLVDRLIYEDCEIDFSLNFNLIALTIAIADSIIQPCLNSSRSIRASFITSPSTEEMQKKERES